MIKILAAALMFWSVSFTAALASKNLSETFYAIDNPPKVEHPNCKYSRLQVLVGFQKLEWRILESCN